MQIARTVLSLACRKPPVVGCRPLRALSFLSHEGLHVDLARSTLAKADAVCFDVDSTVIQEEGIDVLADYLGKHEQVAALTQAAMQGGMKFQDALQQRLDVLQPTRQQIIDCIAQHPSPLTAGVDTFVQKLQERGCHVYLVSGGFRMMIEPVAATLNIPKERIYANTILFNESGNYTGFDTKEPTSRDMGKPAALQSLQDSFGYSNMVMIGDGATDAQAKPPASTFIGFGGVAVRPAVQEAADWFVTDFADLIQALDQSP